MKKSVRDDYPIRISRSTLQRVQGIQSAMGFKNKSAAIDFLLDAVPQQDFLRLISSRKETEKLDRILEDIAEIKRWIRQ